LRSVFTEGDLKKLKIKNKGQIDVERAKAQPGPSIDGLLDAISKFIPGEAVAIFLGTFGILKGARSTTPVDWIVFVMFIICLMVAIGISYYKASTEKVNLPGIKEAVNIPNKIVKTIIPAVAFIVWAINIEGFLAIITKAVPSYDPVIGGLALLVYSTLIPFLYVLISKR
jgi:hypothetical protein